MELFFNQERWLEAIKACSLGKIMTLKASGLAIINEFPVEANDPDIARVKPQLDTLRELILELQRQSDLPAFWPDKDCSDTSLLLWLSSLADYLTQPLRIR